MANAVTDRRDTGRPQRGSGSRAPLSIVAIDEHGSVTKANAPARRALATGSSRLEGIDFTSLMVELIARRRGVGRRASVSFVNAAGETEEVLVVLSDAQGLEVEKEPEPENTPTTTVQVDLRGLDFIAHELRNPLGTIRGMAETLHRRGPYLSEEDRNMAVETIRTDAERAMLVLDSVLNLAEAKARPIELSRIALHSIAQRVVEAHRRRYPERPIVLSGDAPLYGLANALWVELALGNLIGNAEKYTPGDRAIEVAFHQNGSKATILVIDNGAGLPVESYRTIWDLYYRASSPSMVVKGSGIGLALCKEMVEGMGGQVWAGPRRSGGSVFALSLPAPWDMAVPEPLNTLISMDAPPAYAAVQWT